MITPIEAALRGEALRSAPKLGKKGYRWMRLPLGAVALVPGFGRGDGEITADVNAAGIGRNAAGFVPRIVASAGIERLAAARDAGKSWIRAWVSEKALDVIFADHQMSSTELDHAIRYRLAMRFPSSSDGKGSRPFLRETYPLEDYFIYAVVPLSASPDSSDQLYKQRYKVRGREVKFVGKPVEVQQRFLEKGKQKIISAGGTLPELLSQISQSPATQAPGAGLGPLIHHDGSPANGVGTRLQPLPGVGRIGKDWGATGSDLSKSQPKSRVWDRATYGARNSELAQRHRKGEI